MAEILFRFQGGAPAPLPAEIVDPETGFGFRAPFEDNDLERLGFEQGPSVPDHDPVTQGARWDAEAEAWELYDLPPVPEPQPDPYANFVPVPLLRQRVEKIGMLEPFAAYLMLHPTLFMKVMTLETGVDPSYPDLGPAFDEMEIPQAFRDYLLAPPSAGVGDPPSMG